MNKPVAATLAAFAAFGLGGCATIINGTSQDMQFESDPVGAKVTLTDGTTCVTPCEISRKRRRDFRADFVKEGYKPEYVLVASRFGGAMAGSVALLSPLGTVLDASNGSSRHLVPRPVSIVMVPVGDDGTAMLLDDKGEVISSLQEHNDNVRKDVAKTVGNEAAEYTPEEGDDDDASEGSSGG